MCNYYSKTILASTFLTIFILIPFKGKKYQAIIAKYTAFEDMGQLISRVSKKQK